MKRNETIRVVFVVAAAMLALSRTASAAETRSCGWLFRLAGDQVNVAFPDQAAQYWVSRIVIPPGGYVEASGEYPHARYISFITYNGASQAIDGIADVDIAPDPGSTNPFVAGADRTVTDRSYRVRIVNGPLPAGGREPNTIYTDNGKSGTDNKSSAAFQGGVLVYRVYEADHGLPIDGGVGLPALTLVDSSGNRTVLPDCPDLSLPDTMLTQAVAAMDDPFPDLPIESGLGGRNPPTWTRYTNVVNGYANGVLNNETTHGVYEAIQPTTNLLPSGGFFENIHNAYVVSFFSASFGNVLVLRGKGPITPPTVDGEPTMGTGQLRYWSFCTNNGKTTQYYACLNDDAFALDAAGDYTLVISTTADRPAATKEPSCGVAWLPAGPDPQSVLILRHMLPAPDFTNAIQNATQGAEEQVMGDYYPRGTYYPSAAAADAALGCPAQ